MKELIKNTILLMVTCLVASGLLAAVYDVTKPKIDENKRRKQAEALAKLAPDAESFSETLIGDTQMWIGTAESGDEICRIVKSSARGYSSTIKILVAVDSDGSCRAVTVLDQNETPGLGANVTKEKFLKRFEGRALDEMKLTKDGGKIDAITGATITSKAAVKAAREGMKIPPGPPLRKKGGRRPPPRPSLRKRGEIPLHPRLRKKEDISPNSPLRKKRDR